MDPSSRSSQHSFFEKRNEARHSSFSRNASFRSGQQQQETSSSSQNLSQISRDFFHSVTATTTTTTTTTTMTSSQGYVLDVPLSTSTDEMFGNGRADAGGDFGSSYNVYAHPDDAYDPSDALVDAAPYIEAFQVSFKNNERSVRFAQQIVKGDVLYCKPNTPVCAYLGDMLPPTPDGLPHPRVLVYMRFADEKNKGKPNRPCPKHFKPGATFLYVKDNVEFAQHDGIRGDYLDFPYPITDYEPAICFSLTCFSSCFARALFELCFELILPDNQIAAVIIQKVKVCSNPSREAVSIGEELTKNIAIIRAAGTKKQIKAPSRRAIAAPDGTFEPDVKRKVSDGDVGMLPDSFEDADEAEIPENGVYMIPVYGLEAYKEMLAFYNKTVTAEKYNFKKISNAQTGLFSSQISSKSDIHEFLEQSSAGHHLQKLQNAGIYTMKALSKEYHNMFFEDLGIPADECKALHMCFIFWDTAYKSKLYRNAE